MRPEWINCAQCGEKTPVAGDGPIPKYCSASCRSRFNKTRARETGKADEWERRRLARQAQAAAARNEARQATAAPCPYCATPMINPRRKQCGKPECRRAFNADRMRDYQRRYKEKHGYFQSRMYDRGKKRQYTITCERCDRQAVVTKRGARYCSHACWYEASHAKHAQVELAWKPLVAAPRTARVMTLRPLRRRWFSACCPMCSTWFVTDNPRDQNCSPRCGRRAAKDKRRALERNAFVAPVSRPEVYERDQWTCQLCGEAVLRDEVVPHPQAATLDHVVPLARGGTHEPANVQLAHYLCNSIKTDRVELDHQAVEELRTRIGQIGAIPPSPAFGGSGPSTSPGFACA